MQIIKADNVNEALFIGAQRILTEGVMVNSRNGSTLAFPYPVVTEYKYPNERVLFHPLRDANPFFHLFESLWMLGGRNDVEFLKQFNSTIGQFSDDGETLHGAYGHRWRKHFGLDQIDRAIFELYSNHSTRRVVLGMWDPYIDGPVAEVGGKDVPCNTQVYFRVRPNGELDMTVTNRSNDMIWGAYGANAVHMSLLHEYVALAVGAPMGTYYQISNDLHVYERHFDLVKQIARSPQSNAYALGEESPEPLWETHPMVKPKETKKQFDADVQSFLRDPFQLFNNYQTGFFQRVVSPMAAVWKLHKAKFHASAVQKCEHIEATDWQKAALEWVERRPPVVTKLGDA